MKVAAEVVNTVVTAGSAVFDRLRHVRDLGKRVEELERELEKLKESK